MMSSSVELTLSSYFVGRLSAMFPAVPITTTGLWSSMHGAVSCRVGVSFSAVQDGNYGALWVRPPWRTCSVHARCRWWQQRHWIQQGNGTGCCFQTLGKTVHRHLRSQERTKEQEVIMCVAVDELLSHCYSVWLLNRSHWQKVNAFIWGLSHKPFRNSVILLIFKMWKIPWYMFCKKFMPEYMLWVLLQLHHHDDVTCTWQ